MAHLQPDRESSGTNYYVTFTLSKNQLVHGSQDMTAFHFQSLLSNMSSFELKIKSELLVTNIVLQSAVYDRNSDSQNQVIFVENMTCFENCTGLSCETVLQVRVNILFEQFLLLSLETTSTYYTQTAKTM